MASRLSLQTLLETILRSRNVYYQPPESFKMNYPAIVYSRSNIRSVYANNLPYSFGKGYTLTLITEDPDSELVDEILRLPTCKFDRHFTSDNLNHDVFTLYH